MVNSIQTSLSGLIASGKKVEIASSNIANARTTGSLSDPDNAPYSARQTQNLSEDGGVRAQVAEKTPPFVPAFDPNSPFADTDGYIGAPNVNLGEELVVSKEAEFAYKANAQMIKTDSEIFETLIESVNKDA